MATLSIISIVDVNETGSALWTGLHDNMECQFKRPSGIFVQCVGRIVTPLSAIIFYRRLNVHRYVDLYHLVGI